MQGMFYTDGKIGLKREGYVGNENKNFMYHTYGSGDDGVLFAGGGKRGNGKQDGDTFGS